MSMSFKRSLLAVSVGMLMSGSVLATNGYFAHGYSTKEKGLAGAGVAFSQDAMAVATNPAGIAGMGERLDVGFALFNPNRSYQTTGAAPAPVGTSIDAFCGPGSSLNPFVAGFGLVSPCQPPFTVGPNSLDSENEWFLIPHFAYNWQLDTQSSIALGVYGNGGMNTEWHGGTATLIDGNMTSPTAFTLQEFPGTFGAGEAGVNLEQLFFNLSYATKINQDHSVGASVIFAFQRFQAKGLQNFAGYSTDPTALTNNGNDTSTGFGFKLGWQGQVTNDLSLGASYQTKMSMSEFEDYSGLFAENGDFDIPASLSLGGAWDVDDSSKLVFELQQIYYSQVDSIANGIEPLTGGLCFDPLNVAVANNLTAAQMPTTGTGAGCLGGSNGAGFGWDDMTVIKLGYQFDMNDITWRVGASHGDNPIGDDQVLFNILAPGVVETHLTFGFTMDIDSSSEFSFAFMHALNNSVEGPNPFDGGATNIEIEMDQFELQGTYTMKF